MKTRFAIMALGALIIAGNAFTQELSPAPSQAVINDLIDYIICLRSRFKFSDILSGPDLFSKSVIGDCLFCADCQFFRAGFIRMGIRLAAWYRRRCRSDTFHSVGQQFGRDLPKVRRYAACRIYAEHIFRHGQLWQSVRHGQFWRPCNSVWQFWRSMSHQWFCVSVGWR